MRENVRECTAAFGGWPSLRAHEPDAVKVGELRTVLCAHTIQRTCTKETGFARLRTIAATFFSLAVFGDVFVSLARR